MISTTERADLGAYLPPTERIVAVRRIRKVAGNETFEMLPDLRLAIWNAGSILAIPGAEDLADGDRQDRAHSRSEIARRDWKQRVARKRSISHRFRRIVLDRSGGECEYCCRPFLRRHLEIDHVVPVTRGGRSTLDNLVAACHRCNKAKSDMLVSEWMEEQTRFAFELSAEIIARCEASGTPLEDVWPLNRYGPRVA